MKRSKKQKAPKRQADRGPREAAPPLTETPAVPASERPRVAEILIALGLGGLILMRPWFDGITFPEKNVYFVWTIAALAAFWAMRLLAGRERLTVGRPVLILCAFLAVAAVSLRSSIRFDRSYQNLLIWSGHVLLFTVTANALRSKWAIGIVLAAFVTTSMAEATFSILHLKYLLPMTRHQINTDPTLVARFFGTGDMSQSLTHRLAMNRAFGSFLFANALAAWLLLGIPLAIGGSVYAFLRARQAITDRSRAGDAASRDEVQDIPVELACLPFLRRPSIPDKFRESLAAGIAFVLVASATTSAFYWLRFVTMYPGELWWRHILGWLIYCLGASLIGGIGAAAVTLCAGVRAYRAVLSAVLAFALVSTYYSFYFQLAYPNDQWVNHLYRWGIYCIGIPGSIGIAALVVANRWGLRTYWYSVIGLVLAGLAVLECCTLWLTYSRGGMLATFAAIATGGVLLAFGSRWPLAKWGVGGKAGPAALLVAVVSLSALAPPFVIWQAAAQVNVAEDENGGAAAARRPGPPEPEVSVQGVDVTWDDLANPSTMLLRLSYWRTGLRMAAANLWTGVGLGNFKTAYPKYQYLGAGDVQQAHNDFIQMLCETGVFGLICFAAFWIYCLAWGIRSVLSQEDRVQRWFLAGLLASVLGFVLHSAVDFDFFNPSLATAAFLMAGLLFSSAASSRMSETARDKQERLNRKSSYVAGATILAVAAVVAWGYYPLFRLNHALGSHYDRMGRVYTAQTLLNTLKAEGSAPPPPRVFRASQVLPVLPGSGDAKDGKSLREDFGRIGEVAQLMRDGNCRPLSPDETMDFNTVLVVRHPAAAYTQVMEFAAYWLEEAKAADRWFPHYPQVAHHILEWYNVLIRNTTDPAQKQNLLRESLDWAKECVDRSPREAAYRHLYAGILWEQAANERGSRQLECFEKALEQLRIATELYPTKPELWEAYGAKLMSYGTGLKQAGRKERGTELRDEGIKARRHGHDLQRQLIAIANARAGRGEKQ